MSTVDLRGSRGWVIIRDTSATAATGLSAGGGKKDAGLLAGGGIKALGRKAPLRKGADARRHLWRGDGQFGRRIGGGLVEGATPNLGVVGADGGRLGGGARAGAALLLFTTFGEFPLSLANLGGRRMHFPRRRELLDLKARLDHRPPPPLQRGRRRAGARLGGRRGTGVWERVDARGFWRRWRLCFLLLMRSAGGGGSSARFHAYVPGRGDEAPPPAFGDEACFFSSRFAFFAAAAPRAMMLSSRLRLLIRLLRAWRAIRQSSSGGTSTARRPPERRGGCARPIASPRGRVVSIGSCSWKATGR